MSDIKNTLEELVLEKQQLHQHLATVVNALTTLAVKAGGEIRVTKAEVAAAQDHILETVPAGRGGIKITAKPITAKPVGDS